MLHVLDSSGRITPARHQVPRALHWNLYRTGVARTPQLVTDMYGTVQGIVQGGKYLDDTGRYRNSTWVGKEILSSWSRAGDLNHYTADEATSSALFGQIMWTVMYDQSDDWITTLTPNGNPGREERVNWCKN